MEENEVYCDWAQSISDSIWHTNFKIESREGGPYYYDEAEPGWARWLFEAFGLSVYTKIKQH
jgi:hypothetical protein